MFYFEKLQVYAKAKTFNLTIFKYIKETTLDIATKNQLRRASLSIVLNIAEGSGRKTRAYKRNFSVIARGSVFECVAILDLLKDEGTLTGEAYMSFYQNCEELSKMLYAMIQKQEQ